MNAHLGLALVALAPSPRSSLSLDPTRRHAPARATLLTALVRRANAHALAALNILVFFILWGTV